MAAALRAGGAREWQVALVAPVLTDGLRATAADLAAAQAAAAEDEDDAPDVADDTAG